MESSAQVDSPSALKSQLASQNASPRLESVMKCKVSVSHIMLYNIHSNANYTEVILESFLQIIQQDQHKNLMFFPSSQATEIQAT